jgi:large subunit ribosomal protein L19
MHELVRALSSEQLLDKGDSVPRAKIRPGATVRVHFRIVEGKRERLQPFQGVVIRVREGMSDANFTVRRIGAHGVGVERTFPFHSPRLELVEILRQGHVRRANLYYLRGRTGKSARLREKRHFRSVQEASGAGAVLDGEPGAEE